MKMNHPKKNLYNYWFLSVSFWVEIWPDFMTFFWHSLFRKSDRKYSTKLRITEAVLFIVIWVSLHVKVFPSSLEACDPKSLWNEICRVSVWRTFQAFTGDSFLHECLHNLFREGSDLCLIWAAVRDLTQQYDWHCISLCSERSRSASGSSGQQTNFSWCSCYVKITGMSGMCPSKTHLNLK